MSAFVVRFPQYGSLKGIQTVLQIGRKAGNLHLILKARVAATAFYRADFQRMAVPRFCVTIAKPTKEPVSNLPSNTCDVRKDGCLYPFPHQNEALSRSLSNAIPDARSILPISNFDVLLLRSPRSAFSAVCRLIPLEIHHRFKEVP